MGFYKEKSAIVTGGAGMIGYQLVGCLLSEGANVTVLDNFSRGKNAHKSGRYIDCDVTNYRKTVSMMRGADMVFNLAAYVAGVLYNQSHHARMFYENVMLQTTPVLAAKEAGVTHFLQTSSVCVYTDEHNSPAIEEAGHLGNPEGANEGYAWAKRMGESCALWANFEHCVIVRPTNAYGPFDYFDDRSHVIPALIQKAMNGDDTIKAHGTGNERREFIYSSDVARGMMLAMEKGANGEVYNLGTSGKTQVSIAALIDIIQAACGTDKPVEWGGGNAGDSSRYTDSAKIEALGFRHIMDLQPGIQMVVDLEYNYE